MKNVFDHFAWLQVTFVWKKCCLFWVDDFTRNSSTQKQTRGKSQEKMSCYQLKFITCFLIVTIRSSQHHSDNRSLAAQNTTISFFVFCQNVFSYTQSQKKIEIFSSVNLKGDFFCCCQKCIESAFVEWLIQLFFSPFFIS